MLEALVNQINPLAYLFLVIIGWFIVRTLRSIDKNQTKLWERSDDHEHRLSHIEGEHKIFTETGGHKK